MALIRALRPPTLVAAGAAIPRLFQSYFLMVFLLVLMFFLLRNPNSFEVLLLDFGDVPGRRIGCYFDVPRHVR
jgi:hypothetical protein